jgi:hypothetical protein
MAHTCFARLIRCLQALLAKDLDDEMHGEPTQVRVTQGKEPDHFCLLFRGRMVVHAGGVDSACVLFVFLVLVLGFTMCWTRMTLSP